MFTGIVSHKPRLDPINKTILISSQELTEFLLISRPTLEKKMHRIFDDIIDSALLTCYNNLLVNAFAKSLLFSMIGFTLFIITKFLDNSINRTSTSGRHLKERAVVFMKYLAAYLIAVLILASISTVVLYYLDKYYKSFALFSSDEIIKRILGQHIRMENSMLEVS